MVKYGERKWNVNFDVLRILACFLVVLAHASSEQIDVMSVHSSDWRIAHLYNSVGHTGTILFLFISGALLLSKDYKFEPKKFYIHNFLRLFVSYYAWIIIYHIYGLINRGDFSGAVMKDMIINIIRGIASYHFWYVPMLLGIYLLLPMLRVICHADKKLAAYFVALFLVVQIGFTTVKIFDFPHKYLVESLMDRIPFTLINSHTGFFVMGYWLDNLLKSREKRNGRIWIGAALTVTGMLCGLAGDYAASLQRGVNVISCNDLFSVSMCMSAVGLFLMVNTLTFTPGIQAKRLLMECSKLCFGIYMLHPIIWGRVINIECLMRLPIILRIPVRAVLVFAICLLIIGILGRIPVVRQWVIYANKPYSAKKAHS